MRNAILAVLLVLSFVRAAGAENATTPGPIAGEQLAAAPGYEKRVALVIGNSAYQKVATLDNPGRDAAAMGELFRRIGFSRVVVRTNLDQAGMRNALKDFSESVEDAQIAVVFFAGHGIEVNGTNYLIPTDAVLKRDIDVEDETVSLDRVGQMIEQARRLRLIILDACRDNPFTSGMRRVASRSIGRGLGRINVTTSDTMIAFAAQPGSTAADGDGVNSPFTTALLHNLATPGLDIRLAMGRTRDEVLASTNHKQEPTIFGSLGGTEISLVASPKLAAVVPPVAPTAQPVAPQPGASPCSNGATTVSFSSSREPCPLSVTEERSLKPKDVFKECEMGCPEMVVIPAGSFTIGSPEKEEGRRPHEGPQQLVTIGQAFAAGRFAVTFDEWDACAADGGCRRYRPDDSGWGRGRRPATKVSWDDAKAYAQWLSDKTGKDYRLLSEAEREYVTRAGTTTPFWWGSKITPRQANYSGGNYHGKWGEHGLKTFPVNSFDENPFGLYQVHGNIDEWVEDCWNDSYRGAPTDGSARTTGDDCSLRVLRGGGWELGDLYLRSANRRGAATFYRYNSIGFRVARTMSAAAVPAKDRR